jgi:hypothetical protein
MTREQAIPYISFCIDDSLGERSIDEMPNNARLVGWQCGFEPLFVAVWSYLNVELEDAEAEEIARDYLLERKWFSDNSETGMEADYII